MSDATDDAGLDPAEAFALLGDPTRLAIVMALYDETPGDPVSFSRLYDAVDADDTSQFNYHRDKLVSHFVRSVDEGYELTAAGRRIARAVAAGTYTDAPAVGPVDIDGDCYACGAADLVAAYEGELFRVDCEACGEPVLAIQVPPSVVRGRDPQDAVDAVDLWSRTQVDQAARGLCPTCGGALEPSVVESTGETVDPEVAAAYDCTVCDRQVMTGFGALASRHDDVEAFLRARGQPPRAGRYWERATWISDDPLSVVSRDPWRVQVAVHADGDVCRVTFDGSLSVVDVTEADGA